MIRTHFVLAVLAVHAAAVAVGAWPAPAFAQDRKGDGPPEVSVSVAVGPAFPLGAAAERWATLISERVDKAFVARLHPGATLAQRDPAREFAALQTGKADLAVGSSLQWSAQLPALGIYGLPWLAPGTKEIETLATDAALTAALAAKLDAAGVTLVAVAPLGWRALATTARAINGPEDMRGLRLRVAPVPYLRDLMLALEAAPQAMGFADAQDAFANRTLDGQEAMPTVLAATRINASGQRHAADWRAVAEVMVFAVRNEVWQRWPEATRATVRAAAGEAAREAAALAREEAALKQLAQSGVAVVRTTTAGHAAFRDATRLVDARWREVMGADVAALAGTALGAGGAAPAPAAPANAR